MATKKAADLYMGTTEIAVERSAGEIAALLVRAGASQIVTDYREGRISGLRFVLKVGTQDFAFQLPARTEPVLRFLQKRKPFNSSYHRGTRADYEARQREEAERVGWRQLYRWVQAQVALMDLGMVKASEVFFPYVTVDASGQTLFDKFETAGMRLLSAPN